MKKYTYHMHLSILINFLCIGNNLCPINDRHAIQVWIATGECKMKIVLTRIVCISHLCVYVYSHFSLAVDNEKQPLSPVTGHPLPNLVLRVSHMYYV